MKNIKTAYKTVQTAMIFGIKEYGNVEVKASTSPAVLRRIWKETFKTDFPKMGRGYVLVLQSN